MRQLVLLPDGEPVPVLYEAVLPGLPMAAPRPRAVVRGQHAGMYNPPHYTQWQVQARQHMQRGWTEPIRIPVNMLVVFYFPAPAKPARQVTIHNVTVRNPYPLCVVQQDLDNLVKAVLDVLQPHRMHPGVIADDRVIVELRARKVYDHTPRTYVQFTACSLRTT